MSEIDKNTKEIFGANIENLPYDDLIKSDEAVIFRGLAKEWPLVQKSLSSAHESAEYLKTFYTKEKVVEFIGPHEIGGRFFYNEDFNGLNFTSGFVDFEEYLDKLLNDLDNEKSPSYYVGSTDIDYFLPNLKQENNLFFNHEMFEKQPYLSSLWIGNRTTATCHFDISHNLAVCVAGKRRFTLFRPEEIENLYPGPLEPTPGGQVVSLVDFKNPDFEKFPKFANAIKNGEIADMEPGDVLYLPPMWWHHVEALSKYNILINYWWDVVPRIFDTPMTTIYHGILSLRDRPLAEKMAWKSMIDYYVFSDQAVAASHIPPHAQGYLAPIDFASSRRLRATILNKLNR